MISLLLLTVEGGLEVDCSISANLVGTYCRFFFSFHSSRLLVVGSEGALSWDASSIVCPWLRYTFFGGIGKFDIQLVL